MAWGPARTDNTTKTAAVGFLKEMDVLAAAQHMDKPQETFRFLFSSYTMFRKF